MTRFRSWRGIAEAIRRSATRRGRATMGCFSIEGIRLHERALRAGMRIEAVLLSETLDAASGGREDELLEGLRAGSCEIHVVSDRSVLDLTEGREGGLVGLVGLPPRPDLAELLARPDPRPHRLLVACDIEDPGNVGALSRTALASGATAMVAVGITDAWHPKAVRTSMGSVFKLPVTTHETAAKLLERLRSLGVRSLGAVSSGGIPPDRIRFTRRPVAFFLGSEAFGLPQKLRRGLDDLVSIPMVREVDSFSVNAAAAILLYELARQTA